MERKKYIIIGGNALGATTATRLRRLDENAEIIIYDMGKYVTFSNCALPYSLNGMVDGVEPLELMTADKFKKQYNIDYKILSEAINIDEENKEVEIKNLKTDEILKQKYDKLVLATGTNPIVPPFKGMDLVETATYKTIDDVKKVMQIIEEKDVKNVAVIGGGFIGLEVSEALEERGIKVSLIEGSNQVLNPLDPEMALFAAKILKENNIDLYLGNIVKEFEKDTVVLSDGTKIKTDLVILSIGVTPATKFLQDTQLKITERGYVEVDSNYQTNNKDIYAGGDIILIDNALSGQKQPLALAGPANKQGRLIADHIMGKIIRNNGYIGSSVLKLFDYTIASTGLNEKDLNQIQTIKYDKIYSSESNIVSIIKGASPIYIKLIWNQENGKILGAQAIGKSGVDKRIDVLATAIKAKMDVYDLIDLELCYAPQHATAKDILNKLGYLASEIYEGELKQEYYYNLDNLIKENKEVLDIREETEYNNYHLEGVKNIPMSQIRERLEELDKQTEYYVHCKSSKRSYNVVKMLTNLGYKATNINGSLDFYTIYKENKTKENK